MLGLILISAKLSKLSKISYIDSGYAVLQLPDFLVSMYGFIRGKFGLLATKKVQERLGSIEKIELGKDCDG